MAASTASTAPTIPQDIIDAYLQMLQRRGINQPFKTCYGEGYTGPLKPGFAIGPAGARRLGQLARKLPPRFRGYPLYFIGLNLYNDRGELDVLTHAETVWR